MNKNSNIFERIEQLADIKGYRSVTELSKFLGYNSPEKLLRLGREGNKAPSYDIIADFTNKFADLNLRWFLTGNGEPLTGKSNVHPGVLPDVHPDSKYKVQKDISVTGEPTSMRVLIQTVDSKGRENILLVPVKAQAGYLLGSSSQEYVSKLPTFFLPGLNNGAFRAFEVAGYSMLVEKGVGFSPGDVVIGEFVENPLEIRDGQVYIIVNSSQETDNIVLKRCLNRLEKSGAGVIWCKSDNNDYPMFPLAMDQIKEVWRFKRKITAQAPDPSGIFQRLNEHDAQIAQLKRDLKRIEKT